MHTTPEFLATQPERAFATSVRGVTQHALSLQVPFFQLEQLPRMTQREEQLLRWDMRDRYCVLPELSHTAPLDAESEADPEPVIDQTEVDTRPSPDW
jgi:hypothetical protein